MVKISLSTLAVLAAFLVIMYTGDWRLFASISVLAVVLAINNLSRVVNRLRTFLRRSLR